MTPFDCLAGALAFDFAGALAAPPEGSLADSKSGIQRMNGVRSATSVMYQSFWAGSQRAPRAFTASFSAKGVTRLILMSEIIYSGWFRTGQHFHLSALIEMPHANPTKTFPPQKEVQTLPRTKSSRAPRHDKLDLSSERLSSRSGWRTRQTKREPVRRGSHPIGMQCALSDRDVSTTLIQPQRLGIQTSRIVGFCCTRHLPVTGVYSVPTF